MDGPIGRKWAERTGKEGCETWRSPVWWHFHDGPGHEPRLDSSHADGIGQSGALLFQKVRRSRWPGCFLPKFAEQASTPHTL